MSATDKWGIYLIRTVFARLNFRNFREWKKIAKLKTQEKNPREI